VFAAILEFALRLDGTARSAGGRGGKIAVPAGNPSLNTLLTEAGKPWSNAQSSRKGVQ
jgi:hypothetical protein